VNNLVLLAIGVSKLGNEWWHMNEYTHAPNKAGTPVKEAVGGSPRAPSLNSIRTAIPIISENAANISICASILCQVW
jgi:hypothetical protein